MRGEVFAYQASGEGVDPSGQRGAFCIFPFGCICADGRQRLEGAWANANFQITITTLPDHLHCFRQISTSQIEWRKVCQDRREAASLGNCPVTFLSPQLSRLKFPLVRTVPTRRRRRQHGHFLETHEKDSLHSNNSQNNVNVTDNQCATFFQFKFSLFRQRSHDATITCEKSICIHLQILR